MADPSVALSDIDWMRVGFLQRIDADRQARGDHAGAVEALLGALQLAPDDPDMILLLSQEYAALGQTSAAVAALYAFIRLEPDEAIGYAAKGSLRLGDNDWQSVLEDFLRAIELRPD